MLHSSGFLLLEHIVWLPAAQRTRRLPRAIMTDRQKEWCFVLFNRGELGQAAYEGGQGVTRGQDSWLFSQHDL